MARTVFLSVLLVGLAVGQEPPPFGTVIEQWDLPMSGRYAGCGIAWRQDEGRFYLMDQGYQGPHWVWKMDPADPLGSLERVPWQSLVIQGDSTLTFWSLAWDNDSACFWTSVILDNSIYGDCLLLRYVPSGDSWLWGGAPGDSWKVGDGNNGGGLECLWVGGIEKSIRDGRFYVVPVHSSPSPMNHVAMFDPYTKTSLGRVAHGDSTSERGLTLVPYDSSYILTCGWNSHSYRKRDSTGYLLAEAAAGSPADWALHIPQDIRPDDTVCAFCMTATATNTLQRVSLGMVWSQLVSVGVEEGRPTAHRRQPSATVARGVLLLQDRTAAELLDISGRKIMELNPGPNDIRHVAPGVYFVHQPTADSGQLTAMRKVVIQR